VALGYLPAVWKLGSEVIKVAVHACTNTHTHSHAFTQPHTQT